MLFRRWSISRRKRKDKDAERKKRKERLKEHWPRISSKRNKKKMIKIKRLQLQVRAKHQSNKKVRISLFSRARTYHNADYAGTLSSTLIILFCRFANAEAVWSLYISTV